MPHHDDEPFFLDSAAVRRIMKLQGHTRNSLAKALGKYPSEVGRWINRRLRITPVNARRMATTLGCAIPHLTGAEAFLKVDLTDSAPLPGSPAYYARAIIGRWVATSTIYVGKDTSGRDIPFPTFDWDVQFFLSEAGISGLCHCTTPGFEQGNYDLKVEIPGGAIILVEGVRHAHDGVNDMFRAILEFYNDLKTSTMTGGYVVYWPINRQICVGHMTLRQIQGITA